MTDHDARYAEMLSAAADSPAALLASADGIVARGRECREQTADPLRYAAMDCIANAGRRTDQATLTLYLSHPPNWLEAGTIVQFGIGKVCVLDRDHDNQQTAFLRERGVNVTHLELPSTPNRGNGHD